ncbi:MAG: hypothetical protein WCB01_08235 [Candidatus Cybelea sp.]
MQQQNFTPLYPPLQVRAGVLVVDGYGIALRVERRGKLRVEDGIGRQRRSIVLDRAGSGLERLVLIGHEGFVSLASLAWLRGIGAACRSAAMVRRSHIRCRSATTAIRFAARRPSQLRTA